MPPLLSGPTVTTQWLADHLGSDDLVVLDATVLVMRDSSGARKYLSGRERHLVDGHIPGAVFADLLDVFSDPDGTHPFTRPDAVVVERAAASVGIRESTAVVVYDSGGGVWAARLWWLLLGFGFETVAVLDGGLTAWLVEGRDTDAGAVEARIGGIVASEKPGIWADKSQVERIVAGSDPGVLVCALPPGEFRGTTGSNRRPGHLPGSVNVPAAHLVERGSRTFLEPRALLALYPRAVSDGERVIAYCGEGVAAAATALSLVLAGRPNVMVYDGSLDEWAADPSAPRVV
ncbi:thiosulfate/3-mercaptopyruvate sulfurtransferase [Mycetocola sp. CAN_C7]|uniref:sulfurtransferase n=1 Tax=Mycetocola sp. CAN_C7 TaxID=2787724 RepID=UPI0018CBF16B